jgi:hypothetical protein
MPPLRRICLKKDSRLNLLSKVKNNLEGASMFFQIVLGMELLSNRVALMNFRLRCYAGWYMVNKFDTLFIFP